MDMHPKHLLLLKKNAKRIVHTDTDQNQRAFYFSMDKNTGTEILHIDRKLKNPSKFNTVKKLNRTLEPFKDDAYALPPKAKLCAGMVDRDAGGNLVFDVQIKRGVGANLLARSLKKFKRYIGGASILSNGAALNVDDIGAEGIREEADIDPVLTDAEANEDDSSLMAEIEAELLEANLSDRLYASEEQSVESLNAYLLRQQEMFRRDDGQLNPVLSAEELSFTLNGSPQPINAELLAATGLDDLFTITPSGLRLKDRYVKDGTISPEERQAVAQALVTALQSVPGLNLKFDNPTAIQGRAAFEMFAREDGSLGQLVDRRQLAGPDRLLFSRRTDIVPGSEPPRSFLDVVQEMNHADDATFAALNEMLSDAFQLEKAEGRISADLSFTQYKMQFVDLEVGGVLESGLQWHDNNGALGAEEWAFLQMKVKDLPERTQNNYYVQISWKGMSGKPIERKLDINCSGTEMNRLIAEKQTDAINNQIWGGLADEEWSRSGLGVAEGDRAGLIQKYKDFPIEVKLGYWNSRGRLTWDPKEGQRAALINTMDGRDMLEPLVNDIPAGALKTLLTDEDGEMSGGLDLSSEDGLKDAQEVATDYISKTIMTTALTSWTENSTEAMGELLSGIPDVQKVFLRQSNGVVNAVRVANQDVLGAMKALGSVSALNDQVDELQRLLSQPGLDKRYVTRATRGLRRRIEALEGRSLDEDQAAQLYDALDTIDRAEIKDIGQTEVITSGNDTGAFGKCAPTSYFCAALCGVSRAARRGFDLLLDGGEELAAAGKRLEELFTTGAMTDERRVAIDAQIKEVERLIGDMEAQKDEAREKLFRSEEWTQLTDEHMVRLNEVNEQINDRLDELNTLKQDDPRYAAALAEIDELEQQQLDSQQEYKLAAQGLYDARMKAVEDNIQARKDGLEKILQFKKSIADRMAVTVDPADGEPCMEMTFPIPSSALDQSAGDYNGGWLIKKLNDLVKKPENAGRSMVEIAQEDLNMRQENGQWVMDVKVKGRDIQEYLEETNREDKYRGGKKHMMDFFKDPSSMNNIQLMKTLGPGLIAVGCDKMLKTMGKGSGLLYGPSADVVATMVYGSQKVSEYQDISRSIPKPDEDPEAYKAEFERRRKNILGKLQRTSEDGGAMSVSMGYSNDNGHVNYIVDWGTPTIGGVEISSDDVARCRMNLAENAATSSAWNNDRVQDFPINTAAMNRGVDGILTSLRDAGRDDSDPTVQKLLALKANAEEATRALDAIAQRKGAESAEKMAYLRSSGLNAYWKEIEAHTQEKVDELKKRLADEGKTPDEIKAAVDKEKPAFERAAKTLAWGNRSSAEKTAINHWGDISQDPGYDEALDKIRLAAGEMSDFLKSSMKLEKSDKLSEENCLIMPSNTERDNRVSDNEEDRDNVGGGQIGSQKYGSANATDAVYCVPLNCLSSGLDGEITDDPDNPEGKKCSASGYNYAPENGADVPDQFVILTSMSTMLNQNARGW